MIIDARTVTQHTEISADVCIIGGGAAGIAIALDLIDTSLDVVLLESGGETSDAATQMLYAGENVGLDHVPLDGARSRFLGGSTNCWGGWCRPLDPIDFEARSWMPGSGWPLAYDDLKPYYRQAHTLLELGPYEYSEAYWQSELARQRVSLFPIQGDDMVNVINQLSPPTRFGQVYYPRLAQAPKLRVFLNANATELQANATASKVDCVQVATLDGVRFSVSSKLVVLACGGIENARLLLLSNKVQSAGLGNGNDLVGRYFMDHPRFRWAKVRLGDQRKYRRLYDSSLALTRRRVNCQDLRLAAHLAPSVSQQREARLPNSRTYLVANYFASVSATYGVLKVLWHRMHGRKKFGVPLATVALEAARNLPLLLRHAPLACLAVLDNRLNPEFVRREFHLVTICEPVPNPDSRVTLSSERDMLGLNQARLDWRMGELDRQNLQGTCDFIRRETERQEFLIPVERWLSQLQNWPQGVEGCWHHMGTTRMSADPKLGVVDADCRVHGVNNLFVAGSSVFPTVGSDFPTITIVALALRLSKTLQAVMELAQARVPITYSRHATKRRVAPACGPDC